MTHDLGDCGFILVLNLTVLTEHKEGWSLVQAEFYHKHPVHIDTNK